MNAYTFDVEGGSPGYGSIVVVAANVANAIKLATKHLLKHTNKSLDWSRGPYTLGNRGPIIRIGRTATVVYLDNGEQ